MQTSLSELLPEEKRRLHDLEQKFNEVEKSSSYSQINDVSLGLCEMSKRFDQLDKLVHGEPKERREDCKRRISHLRNSHEHIKFSLDSWVRRNSQCNFAIQKKILFGNADLEGGIVSDVEVAENSSLGHSSRMMDDYLAQGKETLGNLLSQRERIKSVQRKVLDILNYLGLSNTIIRVVERRDTVDRWIVYIGMLLITFLVFFLFWNFRH